MTIPLKNTLKERMEEPVVAAAKAPPGSIPAAGGAKVKTSRISWVDHARGIAIMLVVYRHVVIGLKRSGVAISDTMYNVQEVFYNFRMPVFFILSGIFVAGSLCKRSRIEVLKDRAATVLWPYLVWGVIMVSLEIFFSRFANSQRQWTDLFDIIIQPRGIDHLWYLFALFNTSALYLLISKLLKNQWLHGGLAIVLHAVTFMAFLQGNSLVSDAFYFYPYFYIGTLLSPLLLNKEKSGALLKFSNLLWLFPLFLVGQWFWFQHREETKTYFPLFFIINLLACYFVYIIAHRIEQKGHDWLSWLGKYSLYIYILHVPVAAVLRNIMAHSHLTLNSWVLIFICWIGGVLIPVGLYTSLKRFGFGRLFSLKHKSGI
jgi:fucose 4-O-acetylase-like acetyltransferase